MITRLVAFLVLAFAWAVPAMATPSNHTPAMVAVVFDDHGVRPVVQEGIADGGTGRVVRADDPVRIASISKLIMALAAMRLVDEGVVALDTDVSDYLGWQFRHPGFPDTPITLAHLLGHRSGLRDAAGYVIPLGESLEARVAEPAAWYAEAGPGKAPFAYANLGSPMVATVLEAASGERYDRLVERTVFAPLGISACFNWIGCSDEQIARAVVLYRDTGEAAKDSPDTLPPNCTIPMIEQSACTLEGYVPGTNASIFSPQGGVRMGMTDLAKLGRALMLRDERLISRDGLVALRKSILESKRSASMKDQEFFCVYGFGLQAIEWSDRPCVDSLFDDGQARLGHAGEAYGLRAGLWFAPDSNTGIAYFITAVPPRQGAEDEGGFDVREKELVRRAVALAFAER